MINHAVFYTKFDTIFTWSVHAWIQLSGQSSFEVHVGGCIVEVGG